MAINPLSAIYNKPIIKNNFINWATKVHTVVEKKGDKFTTRNFTRYEQMQKYVPKAFMVWIALMQIAFMQKSKDMPKERKVSLMFNEAYSCAIGLTLGAIVHKPIENTIKTMTQKAETLYKKDPNRELFKDGIKSGMRFLSEAIFCMYIGPVLATPLATQTTKYLVKKGIVKLPQNKDK